MVWRYSISLQVGIIEKEGKKRRNLLPQTAEDLNKKISEKGTLWGF